MHTSLHTRPQLHAGDMTPALIHPHLIRPTSAAGSLRRRRGDTFPSFSSALFFSPLFFCGEGQREEGGRELAEMNGERSAMTTCTREPFVPNLCVRVPQQRTASRRAAVPEVVCVADSAARLLLPVQQARAVACRTRQSSSNRYARHATRVARISSDARNIGTDCHFRR